MTYLLAFVVVLAIFGLIHSPNARERLHLQSIYIWSSEVILKLLKDYRKKLHTILGHHEENIDILEISDNDEPPIIEEIPRSDSIEEIEGIRVRLNLSDYKIPPEAEETIFIREETQTYGGPRRVSEERDKVLASITASLRRLSTAASSGKMSGAQLYDILLQETLLHDKAMRKESLRASAAVVADRVQGAAAPVTAAPSAPEEEALGQSTLGEPNPQKEARMYFGQSPLEYSPHRK